jgi:NTE family protein
MSYLLFESAYTERLIELGYADTMRRSEEVVKFFEEARA